MAGRTFPQSAAAGEGAWLHASFFLYRRPDGDRDLLAGRALRAGVERASRPSAPRRGEQQCLALDAHFRVDPGVAGHADPPNALAREEEITSLGLERHVEVLGLLPRAQALDLLSRSRLAVVLAQDWDVQVPAKLYESMAMHIPTLVVAGEGSAAAVEGKRLGATVLDPSDIGGITRLLEQLWRNETPQSLPRGAPMTYAEIADLVQELLTGHGSRNGRPDRFGH